MFPYSVKDYSKESFLENVFLFNLAPAGFLAYTKQGFFPERRLL